MSSIVVLLIFLGVGFVFFLLFVWLGYRIITVSMKKAKEKSQKYSEFAERNGLEFSPKVDFANLKLAGNFMAINRQISVAILGKGVQLRGMKKRIRNYCHGMRDNGEWEIFDCHLSALTRGKSYSRSMV